MISYTYFFLCEKSRLKDGWFFLTQNSNLSFGHIRERSYKQILKWADKFAKTSENVSNTLEFLDLTRKYKKTSYLYQQLSNMHVKRFPFASYRMSPNNRLLVKYLLREEHIKVSNLDDTFFVYLKPML